jgi:hypothetical protein
MITVDTLADMQAVLPACACQQMMELVEEFADGTDPRQASFTALFGGPAKVVERLADLGEILTLEEREGRVLSLLETASSTFDVAEWVCGGAFARFVIIETDLGGSQFYVPGHVAAECPNVSGSIGRLPTKGSRAV